MYPELEARNHAEVAAAAPDRPEQLGILVSGRPQDATVGEDHLGRHEVVDGQSKLSGQPPHATA